MEVLLSSGCLYKDPLEKTFYISASCGFDGVEVILNDIYYKSDIEDRLRELNKISKIKAFHAPFNATSSKERIAAIKRSVELAQKLNIPTVIFHPPLKLFFDFSYWKWFRNGVGALPQKPTPCVENMPYIKIGPFRINLFCIHKFSDLKRLTEEKRLKIAFDTTHCGTSGIDLIEAFEELGGTETIHHIHLSDLRIEGSDFIEHVFPGEGELEIFEFLHYLRKVRYNKSISIEVSPKFLPKDDREKITKLRKLLQKIRSIL